MPERTASLLAGWLAVGLMLPPAATSALDCGPTTYDCAVYYVSRSDFRRAIDYLGETLERSPGDIRAHNLLGIALTGSGQIDKANRRSPAARAMALGADLLFAIFCARTEYGRGDLQL